MPYAERCCISATTSVTAHAMGKVEYDGTLTKENTSQLAQVTPPEMGKNVIQIRWSNSSESHDKSGVTYGQLKIDSNYTCSVDFSGTIIIIVQRLWIYVHCQWDDTSAGNNVFDTTITDNYTITVSQNGDLVLSKLGTSSQDNSEGGDRSWLVNAFTGINDILDSIKSQVEGYASTGFDSLPIGNMHGFIFPGAKVFTYAAPSFSDHQDLVCDITYAATS